MKRQGKKRTGRKAGARERTPRTAPASAGAGEAAAGEPASPEAPAAALPREEEAAAPLAAAETSAPVSVAAAEASAPVSVAAAGGLAALSAETIAAQPDEAAPAPLVEDAPQQAEPQGERFVPSGEERRLALGPLWRTWRTLAMRRRSPAVDPFGRDPEAVQRLEPLLDFLYRKYFRAEVRGLAQVPAEGRAIIVANHAGTLPYDVAMIMHALRAEHPAHRVVRPLVEDFVFHAPYLGPLMNRLGAVRACPENATRLLEDEALVAVFPEGVKGLGKTYAERYQLQRFGRGGFVKLALQTDAPLIPTAVVGAEEVHPVLFKITWLTKALGLPYLPVTPTFPWLGPLGLVPLPAKWIMVFGEPLYFNSQYGSAAASDRLLVSQLGEQVRQRIQEMVDGLIAERRSVLHG